MILTDIQQYEIYYCKHDFNYFVENYCYNFVKYLNTKEPYNIHDYYPECLKSIATDKISLWWSSGQLGMTTFLVLFSLWKILFNDNIHIGIKISKLSYANDFIIKIIEQYKTFPDFLKSDRKITKDIINMNNGSSIRIYSSNTSIGFRFNYMITEVYDLSNHMLYNTIDELYDQLIRGCKLIINGYADPYRIDENIIFMEDMQYDDRIDALMLPWYKISERNDFWKQDQIDKLGITNFNIHYELTRN